ncbi:hypothetical protein SeLEV6574_g07346 [Synchytrium endobioticum]|uniref:Uncharacterized protein n=1 Tax=Synchytrium endobioticum TaxID=286115 RepID=A0A507CIB3_9FUNG|nr:hypothetical protein SeLEV6574_g07346 [Synchytrium endobioticum]
MPPKQQQQPGSQTSPVNNFVQYFGSTSLNFNPPSNNNDNFSPLLPSHTTPTRNKALSQFVALDQDIKIAFTFSSIHALSESVYLNKESDYSFLQE